MSQFIKISPFSLIFVSFVGLVTSVRLHTLGTSSNTTERDSYFPLCHSRNRRDGRRSRSNSRGRTSVISPSLVYRLPFDYYDSIVQSCSTHSILPSTVHAIAHEAVIEDIAATVATAVIEDTAATEDTTEIVNVATAAIATDLEAARHAAMTVMLRRLHHLHLRAATIGLFRRGDGFCRIFSLISLCHAFLGSAIAGILVTRAILVTLATSVTCVRAAKFVMSDRIVNGECFSVPPPIWFSFPHFFVSSDYRSRSRDAHHRDH